MDSCLLQVLDILVEACSFEIHLQIQAGQNLLQGWDGVELPRGGHQTDAGEQVEGSHYVEDPGLFLLVVFP
jgi:hypothetical protein